MKTSIDHKREALRKKVLRGISDEWMDKFINTPVFPILRRMYEISKAARYLEHPPMGIVEPQERGSEEMDYLITAWQFCEDDLRAMFNITNP